MFCSPILCFCLRLGDEQKPFLQPPVWSILIYMLVVEETLEVSDETTSQRQDSPHSPAQK
jgi:hypothetical protein